MSQGRCWLSLAEASLDLSTHSSASSNFGTLLVRPSWGLAVLYKFYSNSSVSFEGIWSIPGLQPWFQHTESSQSISLTQTPLETLGSLLFGASRSDSHPLQTRIGAFWVCTPMRTTFCADRIPATAAGFLSFTSKVGPIQHRLVVHGILINHVFIVQNNKFHSHYLRSPLCRPPAGPLQQQGCSFIFLSIWVGDFFPETVLNVGWGGISRVRAFRHLMDECLFKLGFVKTVHEEKGGEELMGKSRK